MHAAGDWKEFLVHGTVVREEHATRILLFASWLVNRSLNLQFARGGGGPCSEFYQYYVFHSSVFKQVRLKKKQK